MNIPTHIQNTPRFNQIEQNNDNNENVYNNNSDDIKSKQLQSVMSQTLSKIEILKKELSEIQNAKNKKNLRDQNLNKNILEKVNKSTHTSIPHHNFSEIPKIPKNEENKVSEIIKKYSKHQGSDELKVFSNIFKNYKNTNIKDVNLKQINNKIQEVIKSGNFKNILEVQKTNTDNKEINSKSNLKQNK